MANISDIIEQFILSTLGEDSTIEISRNSLADYFDCAPSQINYVLETRFSLDKGFSKESKRGGGGFIKISKIDTKPDSLALMVLENVGEELNVKRMNQILQRLEREKIISKKEGLLVRSALGDEALSVPLMLRDKLRANAFKCVLIQLMKEGEK